MSDFSRNVAQIAGWIVAILVVVAMGILVMAGPFHHINKAQKSAGAPIHVSIVTDPKTIGRYTPATVTARVGQYVIFKNVSNADHTVSAENDAFNSLDIGTGGATWTFKPTKAGTYPYVCAYHPLMHGTIVVTP